MKQVAGRLKGDLAQFRELAAFSQFGSELDAATQAKIDRGKRILELFNQPQHDPMTVEVQVALLWSVQNGYLDPIPVDRVKDYQRRLTEYLTTSHDAVLKAIVTESTLSDALTARLKSAVEQFKAMWT
jgi:F-type H+-transporting ATPase subunit alpha